MTEPEPSAREEDAPQQGLNVVDFPVPKLTEAVRASIRLLPPGKRRLLYLAAGAQVSLGLLDLVGVALIGLVASVAVSGIGVSGIPGWAETLFDSLGMSGLTVTQQSGILALAAVLILVGKTGASAYLTRRITRFLAHRQAEVSARLARGLLSRPLAEVQRWTTSEAIYALGSGASAATIVLLGSAITIASEVFLFALLGIALLVYDPVLTISVALILIVIVGVMHRVLSRRAARNAETIKTANIDTLTAVSEALAVYREAAVLNRRDLYVGRFEGVVGRLAGASASNTFILEVPKYVLEASLYLGVLIIAGVQFVTKDWGAAAATVAVFLAAGSRITPALLRLQGAAISIRNASVAAQPTLHMAAELQATDAVDGRDDAPRITARTVHDRLIAGFPDFDARVVVTDVTLTYSDAATPALADVSLEIPPGSSMAFVGSTGAGKSSLADVILGVHEPQVGEVLLGGLTPRAAINRWPGGIAYVPQAVALIAGTVRDNVALGMPRDLIDDDAVWDALRRAHLADFLRGEREGLDTPIGERGFRLSGGQRQRLGIARALYTRPKLVVLDEATSALDAETELAIIKTLEELEGDVTTITVAHRLATVRTADQVLYLDGGHVIARGTFEEVRASVTDFDRQASLLGL